MRQTDPSRPNSSPKLCFFDPFPNSCLFYTNPNRRKFYPFLTNGGSFEFFSPFHEIRQEKLVSTKLGRGPGRTGEASYVKICFKALSGGGFRGSGIRLLHPSNIFF